MAYIKVAKTAHERNWLRRQLCSEFLEACLSMGWTHADLEWLEKLWWKYKAYRYQSN